MDIYILAVGLALSFYLFIYLRSPVIILLISADRERKRLAFLTKLTYTKNGFSSRGWVSSAQLFFIFCIGPKIELGKHMGWQRETPFCCVNSRSWSESTGNAVGGWRGGGSLLINDSE